MLGYSLQINRACHFEHTNNRLLVLAGNQVIEDEDGFVEQIRKVFTKDKGGDDSDDDGPQKAIEEGKS